MIELQKNIQTFAFKLSVAYCFIASQKIKMFFNKLNILRQCTDMMDTRQYQASYFASA